MAEERVGRVTPRPANPTHSRPPRPPPNPTPLGPIVEVCLRRTPTAPDVYPAALAQRLAGCSGADVENVCREAALAALRRTVAAGGGGDGGSGGGGPPAGLTAGRPTDNGAGPPSTAAADPPLRLEVTAVDVAAALSSLRN